MFAEHRMHTRTRRRRRTQHVHPSITRGGSHARVGVLFPRFGGRYTQRTGCGCGGYRPTAKNRKYLAKWKRGESIGFTMRSSLKAKGLLPRSNGTYRISPIYQ
jgi:hypothetical protein